MMQRCIAIRRNFNSPAVYVRCARNVKQRHTCALPSFVSKSHVKLRKSLSRTACKAGEEPSPNFLTVEASYDILGITPSSNFEEILSAKNKLLSQHSGDQEKCMQIEAAYDVIFMTSMKKRLTGEVEVSTSVRYADVPVSPKKSASNQRSSGGAAPAPSILQNLSKPGGVAVQVPKQVSAVAAPAAVFGTLVAWSLGQAVLESPVAQAGDTAGLQAALALGYGIYYFKENKRLSLGKAAGYSIAAFFAGALLGTIVHNWVRVDIVPLGSFSSPGIFVTEFVIISVWLATLFLL